MVSAIITAAGKNRRMLRDLKAKKIPLKNKLLLELNGKPVIIRTIENVLKASVNRCIIVLGHYAEEIQPVIEEIHDDRIDIVINPKFNVELSQSLYNGVLKAENELCLCLAGDQPSVTTKTMNNLIKIAEEFDNPENIVSIMARGETGFLKSAKGLGMPFVCHSKTLKKFLKNKKSNLNPVLTEMINKGMIFYGLKPLNILELVNINHYDDYLRVKKYEE
ncbi:MAG: NTP transferase domain-containing protein [Methanobacteriaceae archaeon]|nr:NTP transferase domain-containing protein [Methanobacteriaceae archaeon]